MAVCYAMPKITLAWMVFRLDIDFYYHLPDWFMNHVWSAMMFDFLVKKKPE
jgi:hypothetical protein